MISIKPLRILMAERDINFRELTEGIGMSSETVDRLKKGKPVSIKTVDSICRFMGCRADQVIEHVEDSEDDKHEAVLSVHEG